MSRKNREKRRQRKEPGKLAPAPRDETEPAAFLKNFENPVQTPEPATWPGASDPTLARPDLVKLKLADFALEHEPGRSKCRQMKHDLANGLLDGYRELDHWGREEFLWHGLPGDSWHPIEAFLDREKFSPAASTQLRLWKDARIGFFEIGPVTNDLVTLREWDPAKGEVCGADFQAISLNIDGVNFYRPHQDAIQLTYVAPWAPEDGLFCAMGYGRVVPPEIAPGFLPLLGLRKPEVVVRPVPWKASPASHYEHVKMWRQRPWYEWLAERLEFPFQALNSSPGEDLRVRSIISLLPSTPEEVRDFGIYLEMDLEGEGVAMGTTAVIPCDPTSSNALPLAEYRAYREIVGPPRAVKGLT